MLKNQELAGQVLDSFKLAQEAVLELASAILSEDSAAVEILSEDMRALFLYLHEIGTEISKENTDVGLDNICITLTDSLDRLLLSAKTNPPKAFHKIEFELLPFLQSAYHLFYFWGCVFPDKEKMENYYENEKKLLVTNTYIEESEKTGKYKYDLSVSVIGYNKLDYTMQCVESILRTIPQDINYELILLNHGSTDGTKEYFELIKPTKQLDVKVNGTLLAASSRIIEGEYAVTFSNDVIAGENAIKNILKCLKSDSKIGFAVPATSNISNLQAIPAEYSTPEEMQAFMLANNQYDPFRHEQRTRLCNPVSAYRTAAAFCDIGLFGHFLMKKAAFPDDIMSMLTRRAGYKNVLIKDAYCHHFGQITLKDEIKSNDIYTTGRQEFKRIFGIDPWGTGFCYDPYMPEHIELSDIEQPAILGINSGQGSNPLKIKELYKEKKHNLKAIVYNVTNQKEFLEDLRGVGDYVRFEENLKNIFKTADESFPGEFNHIIIDTPIIFLDYKNLITDCLNHLKEGGTLCAAATEKLEAPLIKAFPKAVFDKRYYNWLIIKK
jgi:GT2 family glycosyltransferase